MTDIEEFGSRVESSIGRTTAARLSGEDLATFGARVAPFVRVIVHNYPCCHKRMPGKVLQDGTVMLDDGVGFGWKTVVVKYRCGIQVCLPSAETRPT
jgi:hypothetical protein